MRRGLPVVAAVILKAIGVPHVTHEYCEVDGVGADISLLYTASEPQVGYYGGWEVESFDNVRMVDRESWDDLHPGVEPTEKAMLAVLESIACDIAHDAGALKSEHDFDPPDDDFEEYDGP